MATNDKKKICVLFGAGADSVLGIPTGENFATAVVGIDVDEMNSIIKDHYKTQYYITDNYYKTQNANNWYPKYNASSYTKEEPFIKACIMKKIYDNNKYNTKKEFEEQVNEEYNKIKDDEIAISNFIEKYTNYMVFLDESFHTLINPKALGPVKFWRVIVSYTRAYLFLLGRLKKCNDIKNTYKKILESPREALNIMKEFSKDKAENYYS